MCDESGMGSIVPEALVAFVSGLSTIQRMPSPTPPPTRYKSSHPTPTTHSYDGPRASAAPFMPTWQEKQFTRALLKAPARMPGTYVMHPAGTLAMGIEHTEFSSIGRVAPDDGRGGGARVSHGSLVIPDRYHEVAARFNVAPQQLQTPPLLDPYTQPYFPTEGFLSAMPVLHRPAKQG